MPDRDGEAWLALRETDHPLACCLLFASAGWRDVLADLLSLAHECEAAVRIPSESMLAAIRLQWWVDALAANDPTVAPLVGRLYHHFASGRLRLELTHDLIGLWQDRLHSAPNDAGSCWSQAFVMLVGLQGRDDLAVQSAGLGQLFANGAGPVSQSDGSNDAPSDGPSDVKALRRIVDADSRWLFMLACLLRYTGKSPRSGDDRLLVWRMVGWRWGVRLPS